MQKAVLKLDAHCERTKQKAMATVCCLSGTRTLNNGVNSVDVKEGKLTVTGEIDAYMIVKKLKKICHTEIITVEPVKEPEKKPEPKPEAICHYISQCPPYHQFNGCVNENPNICVIL